MKRCRKRVPGCTAGKHKNSYNANVKSASVDIRGDACDAAQLTFHLGDNTFDMPSCHSSDLPAVGVIKFCE